MMYTTKTGHELVWPDVLKGKISRPRPLIIPRQFWNWESAEIEAWNAVQSAHIVKQELKANIHDIQEMVAELEHILKHSPTILEEYPNAKRMVWELKREAFSDEVADNPRKCLMLHAKVKTLSRSWKRFL